MTKRDRPAGAADIEVNTKNDIALVTKTALCERLQISPWTLQRKIKAGQFPKPIWVGSATPRWRLAEVLAWERDPERRERPRPKAAKSGKK